MKLAGGIQESQYGKRIQLARFLTVVTGFRLEFIPHLMRGRNHGILNRCRVSDLPVLSR